MNSSRASDSKAEAIEREILARITPNPTEAAAVARDAADLESAATQALARAGHRGRATLQGSIAKDTYLAGDGDFDLFLLMDRTLPLEALARVAGDIAPAFLADIRTKYAQHPYVMGTYRGRTVDLVPAYDLPSAQEKLSAVDRTPFHTAWVREHLRPELRAQVRLAKRWLKGTGCYGAQTALAGFSGYLVEVLIVRFGSLRALLGYFADASRPQRIALGADSVADEASPLIVVDPVDPARNCAAAVSAAILERAAQAARDYHASPGLAYFFPPPPAIPSGPALDKHLVAQGKAWVGWDVEAATDRLDIVFPQFQRAARTLAKALEDEGFPVARFEARLGDGTRILLQFLVPAEPLPAQRLHHGPIDDGRPNAQRFREKYANHPLALSPVTRGADGKLAVALAIPHRTAHAWLDSSLATAALGPHVRAARHVALYPSPSSAAETWLGAAADLILDRRPWRT